MTNKQKLKIAEVALKSIAALHLKDAETLTFWLNLQHNACAEVLVVDTQIARDAYILIKGEEMAQHKKSRTKRSGNGSKTK